MLPGGAGAALVLFIGESAYHRLRGHPYDKSLLVTTATRQAVAGLIFLAICLTAVTGMVVDVMLSAPWAAIAASALAVLAAVTWFGLPLARRRQGR